MIDLLDVALALLPPRGSDGLTPLQLKALSAIERSPGSGVVELASFLQVDKAAASRMVASLRQRELVSGSKVTRDRRRFELALTSRGRAELHATRRASARIADELVGSVAPRDRERVRAGFAVLAKALQDARQIPPRAVLSQSDGG
ncbi:MAG: MarR family winged helix-turn-helix transcriptional regulator [Thermoanaerobaculia bacterium]